jgi:methionine sulfoxide reductase heme-binding subunit
MDIKNTPKQHLIVGVFSLALVAISRYLLEIPLSTSFGRVSFILLSMILVIGPLMRLKKPTKSSSPLATPWSWRGELGIWFALTALTHFIIVLTGRPLSALIKIGGSGYGLANFLGLIALFWALILTATSFGKVILFLGVRAWKWLHGMTYVVFYLVAGHFAYFQFFSTHGEIGPDWFGYTAVTIAISVVALQLIAFVVSIKKQRKEKLIK